MAPTGTLVAAGNGEIWVYNDTTGSYVTNGSLSGFPPGGLVPAILYVNQTGELYASDIGTLSLQVIDGTNYSVVAARSEWPPFGGGLSYTYPVFDQLTYVPSTGTVELASGLFDELYRFNLSINRFIDPFWVEFTPTELALDASGQTLLVAGYNPNPDSSLNPWSGSGGDALLNASTLGSVSPLNLTLISTPWGCGTYDGTLTAFAECALAFVGDPNGSVTNPAPSLGNDVSGIAWDSRDSQLWTSDNADPHVYYVNDSNTSSSAALSTGMGTNSVAYDAATNELFFLAGGNVLGYGATNHTRLFNVSVGGTLANAVYDPANNTLFFTNNSASGRYLVAWNVTSHRVTFSLPIPYGSDAGIVPAAPIGRVYVLAAASNEVLVVSLATHLLIGKIAVGTDPVSGVYVPSANQLLVANEGSESISVIGPPDNFTVRFNETGLPAGTAWSVTLNGIPTPSNGSTVYTALPNGTYPYAISPVPSFHPSPSSGTVVVNGSSVTTLVRFDRVYAVNFTETGLPSGTSWSVDVNGSSNSSTGATVSFQQPNGTYPYRIGNLSGWTAIRPRGTCRWLGRPSW